VCGVYVRGRQCGGVRCAGVLLVVRVVGNRAGGVIANAAGMGEDM